MSISTTRVAYNATNWQKGKTQHSVDKLFPGSWVSLVLVDLVTAIDNSNSKFKTASFLEKVKILRGQLRRYIDQNSIMNAP